MLLFKLFQLFKLETDTPCFEAMPDKVSPLCTLYVELDPEFELESELELELELEFELEPELDPEPSLLTCKTFPGKINVVFRSFHSINLVKDVPWLAAIPLNVSPAFTV